MRLLSVSYPFAIHPFPILSRFSALKGYWNKKEMAVVVKDVLETWKQYQFESSLGLQIDNVLEGSFLDIKMIHSLVNIISISI